MRDKASAVPHQNKFYIAVENHNAGFGSYQLVLISFSLIFFLRALTLTLRSLAKPDDYEKQPESFYSNHIIDSLVVLGGHALAMVLSMFSFTVAFMHFQRIPKESLDEGQAT